MDSNEPQISIDTQLKIDQLCDEAETEWRNGNEPDLIQIVSCNWGDALQSVLYELIKLDLEINGQSHGQLRESYESLIPDHIQLVNEILESIALNEEIRSFESSVLEPEFDPETFIGKTIGDYRVKELLSVGGFGIVCKAVDRFLERAVVIKIPRHIIHCESSKEIDAFLDEARNVANLDHRNIIDVFHVGVDAGLPFIVERFVTDGDLKQMLLKKRPTVATTVKLLRSVVNGIGCAHRSGIVHRDLKPSNILVNADGEPVIADFGLSVRGQSGRRGQIAGTIRYMSPEQIRGESHQLDGRSDIWSIGVILYEMLTGSMAGVNQQADRDALHTRQAPSLDLAAIQDHQLRRICSKCLERNISDRYQTAEELERDLVAFQLRESEAKFHRVAEQMPGMVIRHVLHPDGSDAVTYVSPAVRKLFGLEPNDVVNNVSLLWGAYIKTIMGGFASGSRNQPHR